jgi:hypothetical protein
MPELFASLKSAPQSSQSKPFMTPTSLSTDGGAFECSLLPTNELSTQPDMVALLRICLDMV